MACRLAACWHVKGMIRYAVGVDIACRMKLSVLDMPLESLENKREQYRNALSKLFTMPSRPSASKLL